MWALALSWWKNQSLNCHISGFFVIYCCETSENLQVEKHDLKSSLLEWTPSAQNPLCIEKTNGYCLHIGLHLLSLFGDGRGWRLSVAFPNPPIKYAESKSNSLQITLWVPQWFIVNLQARACRFFRHFHPFGILLLKSPTISINVPRTVFLFLIAFHCLNDEKKSFLIKLPFFW